MADLDTVFAALADPTRRAILARLTEGPAGVEELGAPFEISQPAISKHLKVLQGAGLVEVDIDGPRRPRRLVAGPLIEATGWLEQTAAAFEANFRRLDQLLVAIAEEDTDDTPPAAEDAP